MQHHDTREVHSEADALANEISSGSKSTIELIGIDSEVRLKTLTFLFEEVETAVAAWEAKDIELPSVFADLLTHSKRLLDYACVATTPAPTDGELDLLRRTFLLWNKLSVGLGQDGHEVPIEVITDLLLAPVFYCDKKDIGQEVERLNETWSQSSEQFRTNIGAEDLNVHNFLRVKIGDLTKPRLMRLFIGFLSDDGIDAGAGTQATYEALLRACIGLAPLTTDDVIKCSENGWLANDCPYLNNPDLFKFIAGLLPESDFQKIAEHYVLTIFSGEYEEAEDLDGTFEDFRSDKPKQQILIELVEGLAEENVSDDHAWCENPSEEGIHSPNYRYYAWKFFEKRRSEFLEEMRTKYELTLSQ